MKFAIIENEFGEVGVDENIIKEDSEEQIIEVCNKDPIFSNEQLPCWASRFATKHQLKA